MSWVNRAVARKGLFQDCRRMRERGSRSSGCDVNFREAIHRFHFHKPMRGESPKNAPNSHARM
jgi:hypothetical protein